MGVRIDETKRTWRCEFCYKEFENKEEAESHERKVHKKLNTFKN